MDRNVVYEKAFQKYGTKKQLVVAMEEMCELTKELSKAIRGETDLDHIKEEYADVCVVLEQVAMIFDLKEKEVEKAPSKKMQAFQRILKMNEELHLCSDGTKFTREELHERH